MRELTIQEIKRFNHWLVDSVWNHFIAQDKPFAYNEDDKTCRLRTEDGRKCAIGIFIPDTIYFEELETQLFAASNMIITRLFGSGIIPHDEGRMGTADILSKLRGIHDHSAKYYNKDYFKTKLIELKSKIETWN